jgi:transcriptional regulator with XRE-family HTH domain
LRHKRLNLHISDAEENIIPYEIYPDEVGQKKILKAKRLTTVMKLCMSELKTVADKLQYARLTAGLLQRELAERVRINHSTILRYENGQIPEELMETEWLVKIALACGMDKHFCCSPYHVFLTENPGAQIKAYRKSRSLTQKRLAEILGVWTTTVKRWEWQKISPRFMFGSLLAVLGPIDM